MQPQQVGQTLGAKSRILLYHVTSRPDHSCTLHHQLSCEAVHAASGQSKTRIKLHTTNSICFEAMNGRDSLLWEVKLQMPDNHSDSSVKPYMQLVQGKEECA